MWDNVGSQRNVLDDKAGVISILYSCLLELFGRHWNRREADTLSASFILLLSCV
jgi:hypothetical protein